MTATTTTSAELDQTRYCIPLANLDGLREQIDALARRAVKLGTLPIALLIEEGSVEERRHPRTGRPYAAVWVSVTGTRPILNGWELIATLAHLGADAEVVGAQPTAVFMTLPGVILDDEARMAYATRPPVCEHCHTTRNRRETYLVRHALTGQIAQVGSACVRDFTGHEDPAILVRYAQLLADAEAAAQECSGDDGVGMGGHLRYLPTATYLAICAAVIRGEGWVSRKTAREGSRLATADAALNAYADHRYGEGDAYAITADDTARAEAALAWARGLTAAQYGASEYLMNVAVVAARDILDVRHAGILASVLAAYAREQAPAQAAAPSRHQGTIGKREIFRGLTLDREIAYGGRYDRFGGGYLYILHDGAGNQYKWFASGADLIEGETYDLKATVKDHDEYRGVAQTVITRAAVVAGLTQSARMAQLRAIRDADIAARADQRAAVRILSCAPLTTAGAVIG